MYLSELLTSCLRRWPIFLACLLVSGGLFYLAVDQVKPTYASKASIVLVPPTSREDPTANRYLGLGGLKQSVDVLVGSMSSDQMTSRLEKQVPGASFEVVSDLASSAPILDITATSDSPRAAAAMLRAVLDRVPSTLDELQNSVSIAPDNRIAEVVLSADKAPKTVEKTRYRLLGVLGVVLLLASALLVAALDGLLLRRSRRRGAGSGASVPEEHAGERVRHGSTTGTQAHAPIVVDRTVLRPGASGDHVAAPDRKKPTLNQTARARRPLPPARRTS